MSVLLFFAWLAVGKLPALGYAHDHHYGMVVAGVLAAGFALVEMFVVWRFATPIARFASRLPLLHKLADRLKPQSGQVHGRAAYAKLCWPVLWPAGGGIWIGLALAIGLGMSMRRVLPLLAVTNGTVFSLYYAGLAPIAWYLAAALFLVGGYNLLARRLDWAELTLRPITRRVQALRSTEAPA